MKYGLPENHGLTTLVQETLTFKEDGGPALTDVQHAALVAGIGIGNSALVVSPTSTGKTQIGLWAIANGLENGLNTVYLVNYRALARQKFEDFKEQLLDPYLEGNGSALVIATGDDVEDADGQLPSEPLRAPLLVATYEKYLAMLSASGVPGDLSRTVFVCDEIQLLGDEHRGQNVEILLTLIRNAGWKQFVGLSAVLEQKDSIDLSNWLQVKLVVEHRREKHLRYECVTKSRTLVVSTEKPEEISESRNGSVTNSEPLSMLASLLKSKDPPVPIIVFCTKKQDTYDLAREFLEKYVKKQVRQLSLAFDGLPETSANQFLSEMLLNRVGSHNADLMDEERRIVEEHLLSGKLDVVFATTTLAAGVNFPLGAAIFASWTRWNPDIRVHESIPSSEFHNMAGRVGRMGFNHSHGRVIFFADEPHELRSAKVYLNLGTMPKIKPRISPARFNQLALQLVSSGLCSDRIAVQNLICTTFSALREEDNNIASFRRWPKVVDTAINSLTEQGLLLESSSGRLVSTAVGKAIGNSSLLPESGIFLIEYLSEHAQHLVTLLPTKEVPGDDFTFPFLLFSACFSAPEFRSQNGVRNTRLIPYPLENKYIFGADSYKTHLVDPNWQADSAPINAAKLSCDWISGVPVRTLEGAAKSLSAGMLREMYRNLSWCLQGLASIAAAAADKTIPPSARPLCLRSDDVVLEAIGKIVRAIRRLGYRVQEGLPDDALWLMNLCPPGSPYRLARHEILSLRSSGFHTLSALMLGSSDADTARLLAFEKAKPTAAAKANWIRNASREWKNTVRTRASERQKKRAKSCPRVDLISRFYSSRGSDFEQVFEELLTYLKVKYRKLDKIGVTGAPDYALELTNLPTLVIELKSRDEKLVDYNRAVEVLAASEVHGFKEAACVTVCHPGVDPSVGPIIAACGRLCVVESTDLGEALIRYCENSIDDRQLWSWLASPGQATSSDLPYREYG